MSDALAEARYLIHVARNADVVCMTSYAPLFARQNATNWNPNLIYFDNERAYPPAATMCSRCSASRRATISMATV